MKKQSFFISIPLFIFLVVASCTTKEINLITNIDFELLTDYESNGFVKDSLVTKVTLKPERTNYPGFSYFVNYKVLEGDGYFIANDSTRLPQETDILLYHEEDFAANWHYIGTKQGEHKIAIIARDNYEKEKSTTLSYELKPVNLLWEATSPQTMAQVNDTIPFRLVLENRSLGSDLTYSQLIKITAGEGLVLDGDKQLVTLDKSLAVTEGTLDWYYVGTTIGQNKLQFDLAISNDDEKFTELIFDIKEELKNEAPVAVADIAETFATKPIEIAVLENDSDPENDQLTIIAVTAPVNGTAVIDDGKIVYTPNTAFVGNEPFAYTIMDAAGNEVSANITVTVKVRELLAIPDPNFEQALIDLKLDDVIDQKMFRDVAEEVTSLDIPNKGIIDLKGIEGFTSIERLDVELNQIKSINLEKNLELSYLNIQRNQIINIDLSINVGLETLGFTGNPVSQINLRTNKNLVYLYGQYCDITDIDLSQNTMLEHINLGFTQLNTVDLSNLINLKHLALWNTNLITLDVKNNSKLEFLAVAQSDLSNLDISKNKKLKDLTIVSTKLTALDLSQNTILTDVRLDQNEIQELDISKLSKLKTLNATGNTNLNCIQVADRKAAIARTDWKKDATAYYSEDCSQPRATIAIPDANFEKALFDLGHDMTLGDNKIFKDIAEGITSLNVNNKNINSLEGIEGFTALETLRADDNSIRAMDLSQNRELTTLWLKDNELTNIDLSSNKNLKTLTLTGNPLNSVDLTSNTALQGLGLARMPLTSVDLKSNVALTELWVAETQITTIDITTLTNLRTLNVYRNQLSNIDLSKNLNLTGIRLENNQLVDLNLKGLLSLNNLNITNNSSLGCVVVNDSKRANSEINWNKDTTAYYSEDCSQPRATIAIPDANFEQALIDLKLDDVIDQKMFRDVAEGVTSLDVSQINTRVDESKKIESLKGIENFINLTTLLAKNNKITAVDISNNNELKVFNVQFNKITSIIDLTKNTKLVELVLWANDIPIIDVSKNTELELLYTTGNPITELNVRSNTKLTYLNTGYSNIRNIDLSQNVELEYFNIGFSTLESIDLSNLVNLKNLALWKTNLTTVDVSSNTNLEFFALAECNVTSLNISRNRSLTELRIVNTDVEILNLSNNTKLQNLRLDGNKLQKVSLLGMNELLKFDGTRNANLNCIQVADVASANAQADWKKDATASYNTACP